MGSASHCRVNAGTVHSSPHFQRQLIVWCGCVSIIFRLLAPWRQGVQTVTGDWHRGAAGRSGEQGQREMFGWAFDPSYWQLRLKEHSLVRGNCIRTLARLCVQTFVNQLVGWRREVWPADTPLRAASCYGRAMIQQLSSFQWISGGTGQDVSCFQPIRVGRQCPFPVVPADPPTTADCADR